MAVEGWQQGPGGRRLESQRQLWCPGMSLVEQVWAACGWMALLSVRHRAGWLSKEQLLHHLPKPEFQVTLAINYENPCPGVGCAGNVSGEEQTHLTRLGHSSFSCSLGLCCASYVCTGNNSLSAQSEQEENLPIPWVYSCAQKEIVKCCCQNLLSKHSF